jgi:hypothetical protein
MIFLSEINIIFHWVKLHFISMRQTPVFLYTWKFHYFTNIYVMENLSCVSCGLITRFKRENIMKPKKSHCTVNYIMHNNNRCVLSVQLNRTILHCICLFRNCFIHFPQILYFSLFNARFIQNVLLSTLLHANKTTKKCIQFL